MSRSREGGPDAGPPEAPAERDTAAPEETADGRRWRTAMIAAQAGDTAAYHRLLVELAPLLRRQIRARIAEPSAAEDVVQNALLSIHRARHTYRPERPFLPWVRAIARNAAFDALREMRRRGAREVAVDPTDGWPEAASAGDEARALEDGELSRELQAALDGLPDKQREAVVLIQVRGLSVAEAAIEAGVSPGALKVRAHRGYKALRAALERIRG